VANLRAGGCSVSESDSLCRYAGVQVDCRRSKYQDKFPESCRRSDLWDRAFGIKVCTQHHVKISETSNTQILCLSSGEG